MKPPRQGSANLHPTLEGWSRTGERERAEALRQLAAKGHLETPTVRLLVSACKVNAGWSPELEEFLKEIVAAHPAPFSHALTESIGDDRYIDYPADERVTQLFGLIG